MIFDLIVNTFVALFGIAYRWLEQNVINYVLNFVRGFEHVLVMFVAVAFLSPDICCFVHGCARQPLRNWLIVPRFPSAGPRCSELERLLRSPRPTPKLQLGTRWHEQHRRQARHISRKSHTLVAPVTAAASCHRLAD